MNITQNPNGPNPGSSNYLNNIALFNISAGLSFGGDGAYTMEDFLRDIRTAIVEMNGGLKELRDRVTALEGRCKVDFAGFNEKWNIH
jgi:hypothetical protein